MNNLPLGASTELGQSIPSIPVSYLYGHLSVHILYGTELPIPHPFVPGETHIAELEE